MKTTLQPLAYELLGNIASADIYAFTQNKLILLSHNDAYATQGLATEALKLSIPKSLTLIDSNHVYSIVIPIHDQEKLIIVPHVDSTNIPINYQRINRFVNDIYSLSQLVYLIYTGHKAPKWHIQTKFIHHPIKEYRVVTQPVLKKLYHNELAVLQAMQYLDAQAFDDALNQPTLTTYMGDIFEQNGYVRGEKDLMIRFVSLLIHHVIESKQVPLDAALKLQDDLIGTLEFKKTSPPFAPWMKQLTLNCFDRALKLKQSATLPLAEKCRFNIKNHINEKMTITSLASELNCSPSSLTHSFKNTFGITINAEINHQKLKAAKSLLTNTTISVSEIAYILAFSQPSYFMRRFKIGIGLTPSAYRQKHQHKNTHR
ncbi:MAG: AraC family transcriptional regulator [Lactobacillus sp.]|nr:AraC family transcriptional regulator [Lactobacillus sp.]MDN6052523.1 AraC family transcriptional regulator [Lactobacillus sp.]